MLVILPVLFFLLVCTAVFAADREAGFRPAFLRASIVWGAFVTLVTEALSLFSALGPVSLAAAYAAGSAVALALCLRGRAGLRQLLHRPAGFPRPAALAVAALFGGIIVVSGVIAVVAAPNNYDSMTYHLARVPHWQQAGSVAFFPTYIPRQLFMPPWAGYAILHLDALAGSDRFLALVQWFSMVGCTLGVSRVAGQLGAGARGQVLSAVFCVTLPMGISQASTTQCDYVTAFWLVCAVSALLDLLAEPTALRTLAAASSLSLAALTKTTASIFAAPLVVWFLLRLLAGPRRGAAFYAKHLGLALLALAVLDGPFFVRNYRLFGSPLGPTEEEKEVVTSRGVERYAYGNDAHTPGVLVSNALRNAGLHLSTPSPRLNFLFERAIRQAHAGLGLDIDDVRSTWPNTTFHVLRPILSEDLSGNFLHLVLIVGCVLAGAFAWRSPRARGPAGYGAAVLAAFLLFCLVVRWQPWHSRLHLPLFVLWSPVVGAALGAVPARFGGLVALVVCTLAAWAVPYLVWDYNRPLLGPDSIWRTSREDQRFVHAPGLKYEYTVVADFVRLSGRKEVGLILDDYEYPLWHEFAGLRAGGVRLEHVAVGNATRARPFPPPPDFRPEVVVRIDYASPEPSSPAAVAVGGREFDRAWVGGRVAAYLPAGEK
jgi:hypothetical protein